MRLLSICLCSVKPAVHFIFVVKMQFVARASPLGTPYGEARVNTAKMAVLRKRIYCYLKCTLQPAMGDILLDFIAEILHNHIIALKNERRVSKECRKPDTNFSAKNIIAQTLNRSIILGRRKCRQFLGIQKLPLWQR